MTPPEWLPGEVARQFASFGERVTAQQIRVVEEGRRVWALVSTLRDGRTRILGWLEPQAAA